MNTSGDHTHNFRPASHEPRHVELSPEPAMARRQLEGVLGGRWPGDLPAVLLAVSEALVNADRHAGGARGAEAWINSSSVVVQVRDRGRAFDPSPFTDRPPDAMAERGRGLWLITRLADACEIHHDDEGGQVRLRFNAGHDRERDREKAESRP